MSGKSRKEILEKAYKEAEEDIIFLQQKMQEWKEELIHIALDEDQPPIITLMEYRRK